MNRNLAKEIVYGGLVSLLFNKEAFYHSVVNDHYNRWNDSGKDALAEWALAMSKVIFETEYTELKDTAQRQTIEALKGEPI